MKKTKKNKPGRPRGYAKHTAAVTARLPLDQIERLERVAAERGISRSWLIAELVIAGLSR